MSSNYSIFQLNTMHGFDYDQETCDLYLRGANRDERLAFEMACKFYEILKPFLDKFLPIAAQINGLDSPPKDLRPFIVERYFRSYFPQGRK